MNHTEIPQIIEEVGFDFDWDEEDVWKLDYPVVEMDISSLEWHFFIPFWDYNHQSYQLSPREVLENTQKYQEEYHRTMNADLAYPIDIMENKGRYLILDGLHRLLKYKILNYDKVRVRIIPRSEIAHLSK